MTTFLVAHDFSACSKVALEHAVALARQSHGRLILLHVHPPEVVPPGQQTGGHTYRSVRIDEKTLEELAEGLRADGVEVETDTVVGEPAARILEEAERRGVDMIVTGTHGRRGLSHLILGSVAERVVRESRVPVLVAKAA